MLDEETLLDAFGNPLSTQNNGRSRDWDEVNAFCERVYMPYDVRALQRHAAPNARLQSLVNGRITLTCFGYGTPVHLSNFDPEAGNILVLTTLKGQIEHSTGGERSAVTGVGESFVADCSQTDYWLNSDDKHVQLNLTIPHALVEQVALEWFKQSPGPRLWQSKVKFGGPQSSWMALLNYLLCSYATPLDENLRQRYVDHLEQGICLSLLQQWSAESGIDLSEPEPAADPIYLRRAEEHMRANCQAFPTVADVAREVGVSVRALSAAFKRYRQSSPGVFLREQRLQGARTRLLQPLPGDTVASIASDWGYVNFGYFAQLYRQRFHEAPPLRQNS